MDVITVWCLTGTASTQDPETQKKGQSPRIKQIKLMFQTGYTKLDLYSISLFLIFRKCGFNKGSHILFMYNADYNYANETVSYPNIPVFSSQTLSH